MPGYPGPQPSDVHVDAILTQLSVAYIQDQADFIAGEVAPLIPVQKQSDRYFVYNKDDWFRDEAQVRAPGTESAGGGYELDNTPNYFAPLWAFHVDVDDQTADNADTPLRPYEDAQLFVTQRLLLRRERQWASQFFTTGVWGTDLTGVTSGPTAGQFVQWDQALSNPMVDVMNAKAKVLEQTGFEPNVMAVGYRTFNALANNPQVLDRIKYTQRGVVTADLLTELFGVKKFLVGKATVNLAGVGQASNFSLVHGQSALLAYVAPNPGLRIPSASYTFAWTGLLGSGAFANRISRFRMEWLKSDRVEGEMAFAMKLTGSDLGVFFSGASAEPTS